MFAAWTQPDQLTAWWDPWGTPLRKCTVDLRPGAAFEFVNEAHSPPFAGVYRVVEPPSLLVFDAIAVGTVRLEGNREQTNMTVTIRCASAEHLGQFVSFDKESRIAGPVHVPSAPVDDSFYTFTA